MRATVRWSIPLLVGLVAHAGEAAAECAMPSPAMALETAPVPPNPVLYRFELGYRDAAPLRIEDAKGAAVPFTEKDVSSVDGMRVRELHIAATSGTFTVHGEEYGGPRTYRVAAARTAYAAPVVEGVSWVESAWTCSHETGLVVEARGEGVVAFRVVWSSGGAALVPPNDRYFWSRPMGGEVDPAALRAFLGHPNCVTDLIPHDRIGRKDFQLFARYADGTEREVALPRAATPPPPPQEQAAPAQPTPWRIAVGTAVSLAALISLSTLVVARRRRQNAAMVP
jgi:hypothetical protein